METMKNKIFLIEKQNDIIINTTNKILQENANETKLLLEISKEKDMNLENLDEKLKRKIELISKIETQLSSIPVLEHKINYMSAEFDLERKKLNDSVQKKLQNFEKLLLIEKKKNFSLQDANKSLNQSCTDGFILTSHAKGLEKEMLRMKKILNEQNVSGSMMSFIPKFDSES